MAFGESLAMAIRKKGINNTILAEELGVHKDSISRWIKLGSPSKQHREEILNYFNVNEIEFLLLSE